MVTGVAVVAGLVAAGTTMVVAGGDHHRGEAHVLDLGDLERLRGHH
jgi:hypothetical protein